MKNHLIIVLAALSATLFAQSTIQLRHVENNNLMLLPNTTIYATTSATSNTHFNLDVTNTSTVTHSYNAKRYDISLNNEAVAYFCYAGSCYGSSTMVSPNPITLAAGASASGVQGTYQMLTADLDEGSAVGISIVKYTFYNVANVNDSVQISVKYNVAAPVGFKEVNKPFSSFEMFPNPAKEAITIRINAIKASTSALIIFNALGGVVCQKEFLITEEKNKVDLSLENLAPGVYFASIKTGDFSISKKLIIN